MLRTLYLFGWLTPYMFCFVIELFLLLMNVWSLSKCPVCEQIKVK